MWLHNPKTEYRKNNEQIKILNAHVLELPYRLLPLKVYFLSMLIMCFVLHIFTIKELMKLKFMEVI